MPRKWNDRIEWWVEVRVTVKPSDGPCKTYGIVDGFRVGYVPKYPADTVHINHVLSLNAPQVPHTHSQPRAILGYKRLKVHVLDSDWE